MGVRVRLIYTPCRPVQRRPVPDERALDHARRPLRPCHVLAIAIADGNIGLWALGHAFGLLIISCKVLPLENAKANVSHIGLGPLGESTALAATEVNRAFGKKSTETP